ncbi:MAG: GTP-binding protein [Candidatus Zixiibacteriota bacterium]
MKPVRFIVVGGFLGAGKTSLLCRLAERYVELGEKVGFITNDQADNLVDTKLVELRGFQAKEIPGGCFCCRFDDLVVAAEEFVDQTELEILLGEPLGSCADLAATVIQPLRRMYKDLFELAPFSVAVDPSGLEDMLLREGRGRLRTVLSYLTEIFILKRKKPRFPTSIAYLFAKQMEEADIIVLNKVDLLSDTDRQRMLAFLKERFTDAVVVLVSARTGEGVDRWLDVLKQDLSAGREPLEIDYDRYAEAEAELGWLNATFKVSQKNGFEAGVLLQELTLDLRERFSLQKAQIAHLKMFLGSAGRGVSISLVRNEAEPELSEEEKDTIHEATLTINGRVHLSPDLLRQAVTGGMEAVTRKLGINYSIEQLSSFRPAYPTPKYRYNTTAEE